MTDISLYCAWFDKGKFMEEGVLGQKDTYLKTQLRNTPMLKDGY